MHSWDCFDTLIARRFVHPHTIFDEVGKRLNMPNFKEKRIQAERQYGGSYENFYKNLPNIDPQIEIDVEHEHCFPIVENLEKVEDGDLIISDMYHSKDTLLSLLRNCGLTKNVEIIVGNSIKSSGSIWSKLKQTNVNIEEHCGDNQRSDVDKPKEYGYNAKVCDKNKFSDTELQTSKQNFELACFMRFLRLQYSRKLFSNDTHKDFFFNFWLTQANYNVPILCLFSKYLEDKGELAFIYRDCHFLHPLYEKITNKKGIEFHCSRKIVKNENIFFKKYAEKTVETKTVIDLHSSGKTIKKILPNNKIISLTKVCPKDINTEHYNYVIDSCDDFIEKTNPCNLGTLLNMEDHNIFVRDICEHPKEELLMMEYIKKITLSNCINFNISKNDNLLNLLVNRKFNFSFALTGSREHKASH